MTRLRTRLVALASALAIGTAVTACGGGTSGSGGGTSASGATATGIVTAWPSDVATLDPGNVSTDQDKELTMNIYQRLLEYDFDTTDSGSLVWKGLDAAPSLAESYELQGSDMIFHLRDDVTFHPSGNPLTAEDVRYSYERAMAGAGAIDLSNGGIQDPEQITVVDDHTVKMSVTDVAGNPVPASETTLATVRMPNYGIVDSVTVKEHATDADPYATEWLKTNAAGTGPYFIDSRSPGQQMVLKAVPDSWSEAPAYDTVTVRIVGNGNIASLVRGGQVNAALFGLTQKDLNDLDEAGLTVDHQATPDFIHLQMAEDSGPFTDERVRQAVAYAIPYDQIVSSIFFDRAQRSLSYVNLKAPGYDEAWGTYRTDLDQAKALMAEAGNPAISVPLLYSNAEPAYEDMALLIQTSLAQIGITVTLQPQTPAAMFDTILTRATTPEGEPVSEGAMAMFNLSIYLDDPKSPVSFYSRTGGALNYPRFSDAELDAVADAQQFAEPSAEREQAYVGLQATAAEDASFLPLVITGRTVVVADGITGISYSPEIGIRYWTLEPSS
ncbi:ABC transporter substrate-binding protein [Nakamurella leprariae]|uniref:ABC transporter substrate-binding protein n=1 Tax=Nakamurella leprariae TaxID=2803911 RepID=A0A939C0C1_9ACTN|nr:ABC transporter substrate-binding protein [Nakamurella leprariae]MBM9465864.1 ABC transporter substrate-binding protein [Nakamurella leprariae]